MPYLRAFLTVLLSCLPSSLIFLLFLLALPFTFPSDHNFLIPSRPTFLPVLPFWFSFLPYLPAFPSCFSFLPYLPAFPSCPTFLLFLPALPSCFSFLPYLSFFPSWSFLLRFSSSPTLLFFLPALPLSGQPYWRVFPAGLYSVCFQLALHKSDHKTCFPHLLPLPHKMLRNVL